MIVRRWPEGLVVVRQVDHQEQCRLMAERWGNARFTRPEPFGPLARAAAWHDEGWREWEQAPLIDGQGGPVDFPDLDRDVHMALYRQGIRRATEADPWAGLVVSMHGQGLYERRLGLDGAAPPREERPPEVRAYLEEQDAFQEAIRPALGEEAEVRRWAWAGYRLLQAWDLLSLWLLWRGLPDGREGTLAQVPRRIGDPGEDLRLLVAGPHEAACDPYPFDADGVELPVAARVIPDRRYEDDEDLRLALDEAEWIERPYLVRGGAV
jgi:Protein of unknown function (DUF3891)